MRPSIVNAASMQFVRTTHAPVVGALFLTLILLTLIAPHFAAAQTAPGALPPGARQADRHNPFSHRYAGNRSGSNPHTNSHQHNSHIHQGHHHHHHPNVNRVYILPQYNYPYQYGYYRGYGGYPYNYGYRERYPVPYPVYVPQYITVPTPQYQPPVRQQVAPQQPPPRAVASNETARDRARRLLNHGDARLASGDYHRALQRYKSAARAAKDHPDAFFRQAQAYVALGHYEKAADAAREGLARQPDWAKTDYSLAEAYRQDLDSLDLHRDAIQTALKEDPRNSDLWFLIGVYDFFEGDRDAAEDAFNRAFELGPEDRSHLLGFREELNPARPADEEGGVEI